MAVATFAITNARIFTGGPSTPWAEAIASSAGRIVAVGKGRDVDSFIGPRTKVLDAQGRLVLAGFIDAHVHLIWGYEVGRGIDLADHPSLREIQRRVSMEAEAYPTEEIIVGYGFDYTSLPTEGMPKRALDAAVADRPVLLLAYDGHTGWGNTRFTHRALSATASVGSDAGEMQRDPRTGDPTGLFHRVFDLLPLLPEIRRRRSLAGLRRTVAMASHYGITTAFDVQVELEDIGVYDELRRSGGLTVRIRAAIHHPKGTPRDRYPQFVTARDRFQDDWYRVASVKLYIDGIQETGTAALLEPYANNPSSRGETVYSVEEYQKIVAELSRLGFQVLTHACGDRGARIALDAYERAGRLDGHADRRHRVEHCEILSGSDISRFTNLEVIPCMMPFHASPGLTSRWHQAMGRARSSAAFPWRQLVDAGAAPSFASDWPVAPLNPLLGIHEAISRTAADGGPSPHRLSLPEAIDCYTRRAAFATFAEATRGSLAVGKYADLIILSQNLFDIAPSKVPETRVLQTIVAGQVVYDAALGDRKGNASPPSPE